jgi:anti-sigma B factor antagonist
LAFPDESGALGDRGRRGDSFTTDGDHVLTAKGEIDLYTAPKMWEALTRLIEAGHRDVVLDMAGVVFMDSQGVAVISRAHARLLQEGGSVTIRAAPIQVRRVLEITGLDRVIQIQD